jgi:hypothetical protein
MGQQARATFRSPPRPHNLSRVVYGAAVGDSPNPWYDHPTLLIKLVEHPMDQREKVRLTSMAACAG